MMFINPYINSTTRRERAIDMIHHDVKPKKRKRGRRSKRDKERDRLQAKRGAPGVPPNTCPYIDVLQTMIRDMHEAYQKLYEKGEHSPVTDELETQATDMLEYVRKNNETLRDNSLYWYERYKEQL